MKEKELIIALFKNKFNLLPKKIEELPLSGSDRKYYRLFFDDQKSCIGVYNFDNKENIAFIEFTKTFLLNNLNVPKIIDVDLDNKVYLLEDLGNTTLFSLLEKERVVNKIPNNIIEFYKKSLSQLVELQLIKNFDYSNCYPRESFDKQSMIWDLSYFKYYFLKLAKIGFNEQLLENDFDKLTEYLLSTNTNYFMFRDFQARNIMIKDDEVYFIDYQGGRKGALQYDLASILFNSKANLPEETRNLLYNYYINELKKSIAVDEKSFKNYFYGYSLIRLLQAMGAYGFRGFYERKLYFLNSIPFALNNLQSIIKNFPLINELPELKNAINEILTNKELKKYSEIKLGDRIHINITSFSYKKGLPVDNTEHGGGYIFDCRAVHNPGRIEEFKRLTGIDVEVKEFLDNEPDMINFLNNVFDLADKHIKKYLKRNFNYISFNFGCTGGQHRSVYSAERLFDFINSNFDVDIYLEHREQNITKNNL